jgi:MoxR-like ATPase
VVHIVRSLGIRCTKTLTTDERIGARGQHKPCWKVTFRADPAMSPFKSREIAIPKLTHNGRNAVVEVNPVESVPVRCITVEAEDHLFLAGSSMTVTHNCYKANSAILNSLLTLMNERLFHNSGPPVQCPLVTLFGASNELPEGKDLEALSDRFMLRYEVNYVVQLSSLRSVLTSPDPAPVQVLSMDDLRDVQAASAEVAISDDTIEGMISIRDACKADGIIASDRRWKKSLRIVQAAACLMGEESTNPEDLSVLVDVLWREPKEREKVARIVSAHADPAQAKAVEILDSARETAQKIASLQNKDRAKYVGAAASAIDQFEEQKVQLSNLVKKAGKRARITVNDAITEIQGLAAEATRVAAASLGIGRARVVNTRE